MSNFISNLSSYSDSVKIEKLWLLKSNIETSKTKISSSSSLSETKKSTYNDIFNYLNDKIEDKLNELDSWDLDDLLNDIF